jgi:hypothetical protein
METLAQYWKAIVAFIAPGASLVLAAMQDSSLGGSVIVSNEWYTAIITCIITSSTVAAKGNALTKQQRRQVEEERLERMSHGETQP